MLPVALACPVWWVARWAVRVMTSLAVVLACSVGAPALPADAASPARTAPATGAGDLLSAGRASDQPPITWLAAAASSSTPATRPAPPPAGSGWARMLARPASVTGSADADVAAALDPVVPGASLFAPAMPRPVAAVPADPQPAPAGLTPDTVGPRAPPAR